MSKKILLLFALLLAIISPLVAQVEDHDYYFWSGTLEHVTNKESKTIANIDILLEHDQDHLALGEIVYHRKKGATSSIRIYGELKVQGEGYLLDMIEILPNGKCSGKMQIQVVDDKFKEGVWDQPIANDEHHYKMKLKDKPFPFDKVQTYFKPLKENLIDGVYSLHMDAEQPAYDRLEICSLANKVHIANFMYENDSDLESVFMTMNEVSDRRLNFSNDEYNLSTEIQVYEDFIYFNQLYDPENVFGNYNKFFIRQPNKEAIICPRIDYEQGILVKCMKIERDEDEVRVFYDKDQLLACGLDEESLLVLNTQWITLGNVRPGVKQIFMGIIGNQIHPVLAVLNQDGTVQMISLFDSAENTYFSVSEPLKGFENIVGFTYDNLDEEHDYQTFYAVDKDGNKKEILINQFGGDWELTQNSQDGAVITSHWLNMTEDWTIHYNLDVKNDPEKGSYFENLYGHCWPDPEDSSLIHYVFTSYNDSHNPGPEVVTLPCQVEGTLQISKEFRNGFDYLVIDPKSGVNFYLPKDKPGYFKKIKVVG